MRADYGSIFEGWWVGDRIEGFGRYIYASGAFWIGWWKNDWLQGNCRKFHPDGTLEEEGWYEDDCRKSGFRRKSKKYKYWEMRHEYFARNENIKETNLTKITLTI